MVTTKPISNVKRICALTQNRFKSLNLSYKLIMRVDGMANIFTIIYILVLIYHYLSIVVNCLA